MKEGFAVPYAVERVKEHLYNFTRIYEDLCRNTVDTEWLTRLEKQNNLFPDLNYRIFKKLDP
jgi:1,4-alpha-glucan branching enzyme